MSISISGIKSTLGVSTNSLKALCQSGNINKWSAAKPGSLSYNSNGFYWNAPSSSFKLSDFNGYNHSAAYPFSLTMDEHKSGNSCVVVVYLKHNVGNGCVNLYNMLGSGWNLRIKSGSSSSNGNGLSSSGSSATITVSGEGSHTISAYLYKDSTEINLGLSLVTTIERSNPSIGVSSVTISASTRLCIANLHVTPGTYNTYIYAGTFQVGMVSNGVRTIVYSEFLGKEYEARSNVQLGITINKYLTRTIDRSANYFIIFNYSVGNTSGSGQTASGGASIVT